ncbi:MAG: hypothetical protein HZA48_02170 [Planctomycetes bacterium]|nr:hypothetical protein [Planctomycetota bacterium]
MKTILAFPAILFLFTAVSCAETPAAPVLPQEQTVIKQTTPQPETNPLLTEDDYINEALKMLGLEQKDTEFKKDHRDDPYRLQMVQDSLHKPLELPKVCESINEKWKSANTITDALNIQIEQLGKWWDCAGTPVLDGPAPAFDMATLAGCPEELKVPLARLLGSMTEARKYMDAAFGKLSPDERKYLIANVLPDMILDGDSVKDDFQIEAEKVELTMLPPEKNIPEIQGRDEIYPEQVEGLKLTLKIEYPYMHIAALKVAGELDNFMAAVRQIDFSTMPTVQAPAEAVAGEVLFYAETSQGIIIIGNKGENTYYKDTALIVDIGGNDRYLARAGGAIGATDSAVSICLDLSGDDYYTCTKKFSQAGGLFGIGFLADLAGKDIYEAGHFTQGCGVFGIGILWDRGEGDDYYSADHLCQGAGGWGTGILYDEAGDSRYFSRTFSQGLGMTLGAGALIDDSGDDYYIAAATIMNDRPYSMSQGFGQGQRPIASGGIGTLIDSQGNDHYTAFFYAQGCAYWYGLGILMDNAGNDRYDAQVYAQGCGIHLSSGVLMEGGGSDFYNCTFGGNAQGAAHDWAVGLLLDKNGSDVYAGRGNNQGSAITNAFALFIDSEGDDIYQTTKGGGQGYGGAARDSYSIGLFLDLGGNDFYSEEYMNPGSGNGNGRRWIKGEKGAGIDEGGKMKNEE